jgi:DNA mismatch endonuclease (patch repair protein)
MTEQPRNPLRASLAPAPPASSATARKIMKANRSDSRLERRLRSELHRRGLRFRKHLNVMPGVRCRPDVVFTRVRIAVFVDGCFWHSCPVHGSSSKANADWWRAKLARNVERDRRNDDALAREGWTVLRFWEHQEIDEMADAVAVAIASAAPRHVRG